MADPNMNLGKLDGLLFIDIKDYLDVSPDRLRSFVATLDGEFSLNIRHMQPGSALTTQDLISELSARNMTIGQFAHYATLAEDQHLLEILNIEVPITVQEWPPSEVFVTEDEPLTLTVRASGFPNPSYQWIKDGTLLPEQTRETLRIEATSVTDKGQYQCCVFRPDNLENFQISPSCNVIVYIAAPIEIYIHPKPCCIQLGGSAAFRCEVVNPQGITYQWFKNDEALNETDQIVGTCTSELRLYNLDSTMWQGSYYCQVSKGHQVERTQAAPLLLETGAGMWESLPDYTATDKVALLIGCNDYRGDTGLSAPPFDVQTLATAFQSLHFKVVSLLNLTKTEMLSAIHEFRQLVGEGVYCVFYFCGHGFESSNHCFLVPVDAPHAYDPTHCIEADLIFNQLLNQGPQLCCMILDICRKNHGDFSPQPRFVKKCVNKAGHSIVCFATCPGMAAYEGKKDGILVSHLKKFLHHPISVESVFSRLREELGRDPRVNNERHRQIADVRSNLTEPRRSFTNPIVYNGFTSQFCRRKYFWETAHRKPDNQLLTFQFPDFEVKVELSFQQEFSNVLKIFATVKDPGPTDDCRAWVMAVSMEVGEKADVSYEKYGNSDSRKGLCSSYVSLRNIQRLQDELTIQIAVECDVGDKKHRQHSEIINLKRPLVATLQLWRERPSLRYHRVAEEQDER